MSIVMPNQHDKSTHNDIVFKCIVSFYVFLHYIVFILRENDVNIDVNLMIDPTVYVLEKNNATLKIIELLN